MKYPNRLRQRRNELHKTIEEIAMMIDVTITSVYRWERGEVKPTSRNIQRKMFKAYNISPKEAYPLCWEDHFAGIQGEF